MRCIWRIGWANVQRWGALFTAVGLTNGKIDGGAARTDGGEVELCGTFRNTPEGCHCGRKKYGNRASGKRRKREERRSYVGRDGARTETENKNQGTFVPKPADIRQNVGLFRRNEESCR